MKVENLLHELYKYNPHLNLFVEIVLGGQKVLVRIEKVGLGGFDTPPRGNVSFRYETEGTIPALILELEEPNLDGD